MHGKLKINNSPHEIGKTVISRGKSKTANRFAGFTLTEVVIASALLIIAMVPILKGLTSANLGTVIIERKSRSLLLAQAKLDEIKARSIYNYSDSFTQANVSLDGPYLCNVDDSSISTNLRKITVSVGYDLDGDNTLDPDEIEVALATCVAKRWGS
jgi:type II secretory pathway pseudopilin PulG